MDSSGRQAHTALRVIPHKQMQVQVQVQVPVAHACRPESQTWKSRRVSQTV